MVRITNFEWHKCIRCGKMYKRRKTKSTLRLHYTVRPFNAKTCSRQCHRDYNAERCSEDYSSKTSKTTGVKK